MASTNTGTARGESPSTVSGSIYEEFSPGNIIICLFNNGNLTTGLNDSKSTKLIIHYLVS